MAPVGEVCSTIRSAGWVRVGAVVSETRTVKATWLLLPAASVATHVTVVAPGAKSVPLAGVQATLGLASPASLTTGVG